MQFNQVNFVYTRHANDYVYAFDLTPRYHGWTRDKQSNFHVYDEQTGGYTSYETKAAFEQFLSSLNGQGNYQTQYTGNKNINIPIYRQPEFKAGNFNMGPVIFVGGILAIIWLIMQK